MAEYPEELTQENVSDEDKTKSCDPCTFRGDGKLADSYCLVCDEYLCLSCVEIHLSFKATRAHELVGVVESAKGADGKKGPVKSVMICDIHRSENVTEFCVTHENAICRLCKKAKHRQCNTKELGEAAEERRNEVQNFITDITSLSSELEEIKNSRQNDKNQLFETTTRIRANIKNIKEEIIKWAEKLEKVTIEEVERTEREMLSKIDNHIVVAEDIMNQLKYVTTEFEEIGSDCSVAAFVYKAKSKQQIQEGRELKQEIEKEINPFTCDFRKSETLSRLMSEISFVGTIEIEETRPMDFTGILRVTKKQDISVQSNGVNGCVFMPNGRLVICDYINYTVKVLSTDFQFENELKCNSRVWDVAVLSTDEVIVTKPESMCLDVLNVSGTVRKVKSIPVGEQCWGVDIKKDNIYVSCHLDKGKGGSIKVLTLDGVCVNTFRIDEESPFYLAVNEAEDRIIVCRDGTAKVVCIDMTGNTIFTYTDNQMKSSLGLTFDSHDNFMVCGRLTGNVHVVKKDGTKHKVLLSSADGRCQPYCLAYRSSDKTLVVRQCTTKSVVAFSMEI